MTRQIAGLLLGAVLAVGAAPRAATSPAAAVDLKCEYAVDPLGVDVPAPRLFWRIAGQERGLRQTAWQVWVASSRERLAQNGGELWDSGRVASAETTGIPYSGKPLSQQVFWKVRSWDQDGQVSDWSAPAVWTMGLLARTDWKGAWIMASNDAETQLLRRAFTVKPGLRRAVVHVCGLGQYELTLNGVRVGDDRFAPGWTNFNKTILYQTYDVTPGLHEGANAAGLFLGNGMYRVVRPPGRFAKFTGAFGPLCAILHLWLEYADGTVAFVGTDGNWRAHPGPETFAGIYGGEDRDARLVPAGWDRPGFDDQAWAPAVPAPGLPGTLRGLTGANEPVRASETRMPVAVRPFPDGTAVYDFGQNAAFVPRLRFSGPAGATLRLTPAEVVKADGTIDRETMGKAHRGSSWWQDTLGDDGGETWYPELYYVGSRYLKAEWLAANGTAASAGSTAPLPKIDSLEAVVVRAAVAPVGQFACSDERLNRIRELVRRAQAANLFSLVTDCPHREKLGWIEQLHLNGPSVRYEWDATRTFAKAERDMAEAQVTAPGTPEHGLVPNIAPEYVTFAGAFRSAAEWGAAFIAVPWQQYLFTGDPALFRAHFPAMQDYFAFLETRAKDGILADGLGDWYDWTPEKGNRAGLTPPEFTATAFFQQDAALLARIAGVLGRTPEAQRYAARAEEIRTAFNRRFFHADTGSYATGSQCANALALALDLPEPADRPRVLAALVRDVETRGYATTGGVGFRYLLRALADAGRSDLILRLVTQDENPGYGWQLAHGATTLTEAWDASREASQDHFMLGQVIEWLYADLAGIAPDPEKPGFANLIVRPQPIGDLTWTEAGYDSIRGPVKVRWERDGQRLRLHVSIPANTTATVFVPARAGSKVEEGA